MVQTAKSHNHLDKNIHLCNKKALFYNIKNYCQNINENPFDYIPITFHIQDGLEDKEYLNFKNFFKKQESCNALLLKEIKSWERLSEPEKKKITQQKNIYIIKPGENTNRGTGITIESELCDIERILQK